MDNQSDPLPAAPAAGDTGGGTDGAAAEVAAVLERLTRLVRRLSPPAEYSLTAAATLATLERSGPCRLTDLAVREGVTQPAMTQLVSRLQAAGFVGRATDPHDGRVVLIHISDEGRASLARRRTVRAERIAGVLDRLDPGERDALLAALPAMESVARLGEDDRAHRKGAASS
jgi:DNA-binding MarR family transcriptional regulator